MDRELRIMSLYRQNVINSCQRLFGCCEIESAISMEIAKVDKEIEVSMSQAKNLILSLEKGLNCNVSARHCTTSLSNT